MCEFLEKKSKEFQTLLKPVGSISLDGLRQKSGTGYLPQDLSVRLSRWGKEGKKVCLYATTNYFQNNCYSSYEPPPSDIRLYETQLTLISELSSYSGVGLILKLSPNPTYRRPPWVDYFKDDSLVIIDNECKFSELLGYADLVVLDWPSTTLLQAIATDKPVFVVMKHLWLFPRARRMLERRVVCADEPGELLSSLKEYLGNGIYPADINDNAFLKAYGTYHDDGHTGERAVAVVLQAVGIK